MNVYHGGTSPVSEDIDLYFDNVVIARKYIGPANFGETPSSDKSDVNGDSKIDILDIQQPDRELTVIEENRNDLQFLVAGVEKFFFHPFRLDRI